MGTDRDGRGSWQLLRMTPLSPGVVLRGKLLSVAWPLLLLLCATLPGYVVMMTIEPALVHQVQRVVACLAFNVPNLTKKVTVTLHEVTFANGEKWGPPP